MCIHSFIGIAFSPFLTHPSIPLTTHTSSFSVSFSPSLPLPLSLPPYLSLSLQDAESHRRSREAVLLELLGEKEETIEELVEDMKTVKHMYVRLVGREEGEKRRLRS